MTPVLSTLPMGPYCDLPCSVSVGRGGEDRAQSTENLPEGLASFIDAFQGSLIPQGILEPLPAPPEWIKEWKKLKAREKRKSKGK